MSKYKVGDKVVLTVTSTNEMGCLPCYVLNDDLILSKQDIDKYTEPLSTYTEPLEAKIRRQAAEITRLRAQNKELKEESKRNYTINIEMARAEGYSEAWELARKIILYDKDSYSGEELKEIFGYAYSQTIMKNYTYQEVAAKVAEWEKGKEEIKVGDVVSHEEKYEEKYGVVISEGTICFRGFTDDGTPFEWYKERCTKTGRHIDIDSFLKQIGEK